MKLKKGMVLVQVSNDYVAVPTGDASREMNGVLRMNMTAADIWHGIEKSMTPEEIAQMLVDNYEDVSIDDARVNVENTLKKFREAGALQD